MTPGTSIDANKNPIIRIQRAFMDLVFIFQYGIDWKDNAKLVIFCRMTKNIIGLMGYLYERNQLIQQLIGYNGRVLDFNVVSFHSVSGSENLVIPPPTS